MEQLTTAPLQPVCIKSCKLNPALFYRANSALKSKALCRQNVKSGSQIEEDGPSRISTKETELGQPGST